MTRTLAIALVSTVLSSACARAHHAPRVCEASTAHAKEQPTVVGMCTLDAPPASSASASASASGEHDEDAGLAAPATEPTPATTTKSANGAPASP